MNEAIERINKAISRVEQALEAKHKATSDLRLRHEKLRSAVAQSLGQLDGLIDAAGESESASATKNHAE